MWPFCDFQYGFRSSWSTADLRTVLSDRIARPFNISGATLAVLFDRVARAFKTSGATCAGALDICKAFDRIWHARLLNSRRNRQLQVVLDGKSSQEYRVNTGVHQIPVLVLHFSYYTLMTFMMTLSVILVSMLMILLSILSVIRHLICGNNLKWLLNLNLIYKTLWTGERNEKWLDFNAGQMNWFCLTIVMTLVLLM